MKDEALVLKCPEDRSGSGGNFSEDRDFRMQRRGGFPYAKLEEEDWCLASEGI